MANKRMPAFLLVVLVVLVLQAAANGFVGFVLQDEIDSRLEHGQEVVDSGLVHTLVYVSYLVAAVLLVCIAFLALRRSWARYPVYVIETLSIISGLIVLLVGNDVTGIVNLALAAGVLTALARQEVTEWLDPQTDGTRSPANWPRTAA